MIEWRYVGEEASVRRVPNDSVNEWSKLVSQVDLCAFFSEIDVYIRNLATSQTVNCHTTFLWLMEMCGLMLWFLNLNLFVFFSEIGYSPAAAGGLGLGWATGEERDGGRWCRARRRCGGEDRHRRAAAGQGSVHRGESVPGHGVVVAVIVAIEAFLCRVILKWYHLTSLF